MTDEKIILGLILTCMDVKISDKTAQASIEFDKKTHYAVSLCSQKVTNVYNSYYSLTDNEKLKLAADLLSCIKSHIKEKEQKELKNEPPISEKPKSNRQATTRARKPSAKKPSTPRDRRK